MSVSREKFLQAMKLGALEEYILIGEGITDLGITYDADTDTKRYIIDKAGRTTNKGYTLSSDVEQEVFPESVLFKEIDKIRRGLLIGDDAKGKLININKYESSVEQPASVSGEEFDIEIVITGFAGSSEDPLSINYTINYQGAPVLGKVAIDYTGEDAKFTFTKDEAVEG